MTDREQRIREACGAEFHSDNPEIQPRTRCTCDAVRAFGDAERTERDAEWRKTLWLRHGHLSILYGDDGEKQCNVFPPLDFKRLELIELVHGVFEHARKDERDRINAEWRKLLGVAHLSIGTEADMIAAHDTKERDRVLDRIEAFIGADDPAVNEYMVDRAVLRALLAEIRSGK